MSEQRIKCNALIKGADHYLDTIGGCDVYLVLTSAGAGTGYMFVWKQGRETKWQFMADPTRNWRHIDNCAAALEFAQAHHLLHQ